tara:strand:- start:5478 stop:6338 length:861 start_codon:yes stop_codon:yes gene_type:complete
MSAVENLRKQSFSFTSVILTTVVSTAIGALISNIVTTAVVKDDQKTSLEVTLSAQQTHSNIVVSISVPDDPTASISATLFNQQLKQGVSVEQGQSALIPKSLFGDAADVIFDVFIYKDLTVVERKNWKIQLSNTQTTSNFITPIIVSNNMQEVNVVMVSEDNNILTVTPVILSKSISYKDNSPIVYEFQEIRAGDIQEVVYTNPVVSLYDIENKMIASTETCVIDISVYPTRISFLPRVFTPLQWSSVYSIRVTVDIDIIEGKDVTQLRRRKHPQICFPRIEVSTA